MKTGLLATVAVIGLGLGGAALAQTDSTRSPSTAPGPGTPPAAKDQASPSTGAPGMGGSSMGGGSMGSGTSGMPGSSSTMTTAPDVTGGGSAMAGVDAGELIGADIKNADNRKVGEVQAVQLDAAGKVRNLIVGVGGFMGLGERAVSLDTSKVTVADGGDTLRTTLTEEQLKAMPEYQYSDRSYRGKLFNDSGVVAK